MVVSKCRIMKLPASVFRLFLSHDIPRERSLETLTTSFCFVLVEWMFPAEARQCVR